MADVDTKPSALDVFAAAPPRSENLPAAGQQIIPPARVMGAQRVAVYRDEVAVLERIKVAAQAAGDDFYYRFPVRNNRTGQTDSIEGPSIKAANAVARLYGNCEVDTHVVDLGDAWMIYARFTDFETGFTLVRPFQQRKSQRSVGGKDDGRALDIALQIGASKAIRNVVTNALSTFTDFAFEEAKKSLVDRIGKDVVGWRERVSNRLAEQIDIRRVEAVIGRPVSEWTAPDVARVMAMGKAVADGMATWDDTFPPLNTAPAEADGAKLTEFAEGKGKGKGRGKPEQSAAPATAAGGGQEAAPAPEPAPQAGQAPTATAAAPEPEIGGGGEPGPGEDREQTPVDAAWERGYASRRRGMARRAVPGEYRDDPGLSAAWAAGWDEADAEIGGGE